MKTSSAKAKGRRLCQETKALLLKTFPELEDADIVVTAAGKEAFSICLRDEESGIIKYLESINTSSKPQRSRTGAHADLSKKSFKDLRMY